MLLGKWKYIEQIWQLQAGSYISIIWCQKNRAFDLDTPILVFCPRIAKDLWTKTFKYLMTTCMLPKFGNDSFQRMKIFFVAVRLACEDSIPKFKCISIFRHVEPTILYDRLFYSYSSAAIFSKKTQMEELKCTILLKVSLNHINGRKFENRLLFGSMSYDLTSFRRDFAKYFFPYMYSLNLASTHIFWMRP